MLSFLFPSSCSSTCPALFASLPPALPVLACPDLVCRAQPFTGCFPEAGPPVVEGEGVGHRFKAALEAAENIMAGYHNSPDTGGWHGAVCRWHRCSMASHQSLSSACTYPLLRLTVYLWRDRRPQITQITQLTRR